MMIIIGGRGGGMMMEDIFSSWNKARVHANEDKVCTYCCIFFYANVSIVYTYLGIRAICVRTAESNDLLTQEK